MGRTEGTSNVRPSVPSGTGWTVGIQGLGRTEGTSHVYLFNPLVRCEVKLSVDACRQYWTSMIARLKELKEMPNSSTWLKDHVSVFSNSQQLGGQNIFITEDEKEEFMRKVYRQYIQSVIDHISNRLMTSDIYLYFSVFDPRLLHDNEEDLSSYGELKMNALTTFYG